MWMLVQILVEILFLPILHLVFIVNLLNLYAYQPA